MTLDSGQSAMTSRPDCQRHPDGTIDYDFYRARGASLRAQGMRDALLTAKTLTRLPAVVGAVGALLLGLSVASTADQKHPQSATAEHHAPR